MESSSAPTRLKVRIVSDSKEGGSILQNINLDLKKGRILGVMGSSKSGKSEFAEACVGLRKVKGEIFLDGKRLQTLKSETILENIGYIPKDPYRGVVGSFSIAENLIVGNQHREPYSKRRILNKTHIVNHANKLVEEYNIIPPDISLKTAELSGGNLKKVLVSREISKSPKLLVAENPTAGLDIETRKMIFGKIGQLKKQGASIILITEDVEEAKKNSDRIMVLYEGKVIGSDKPSELTREKIGRWMLGDNRK